MPHLVPGDFHVDKLLGNVGLKWKNPAYIGSNVVPVVTVMNETDKYADWGKSAWFRDEVKRRAAGDAAGRIGLDVTLTNTYTAEEFAIAAAIPWRVKKNADSALKLNIQVTELLADAILRARDRRISSLIFDNTGTTWHETTLTGTDQWSDADDSDPISDIDAGVKSVLKKSAGHYPTDMVLGVETYWKLRRHPEIVKHIFAGGDKGPQNVTPAMIGRVFDIPNVHVGYSQYTADLPGTAEASVTYTDIWGKHCWIGFCNKTPSMWTPSAVYQFRVQQQTRTWMDTEGKSDIIEVSEIVDEKLIAKDCGYLIINAVA